MNLKHPHTSNIDKSSMNTNTHLLKLLLPSVNSLLCHQTPLLIRSHLHDHYLDHLYEIEKHVNIQSIDMFDKFFSKINPLSIGRTISSICATYMINTSISNGTRANYRPTFSSISPTSGDIRTSLYEVENFQ